VINANTICLWKKANVCLWKGQSRKLFRNNALHGQTAEIPKLFTKKTKRPVTQIANLKKQVNGKSLDMCTWA